MSKSNKLSFIGIEIVFVTSFFLILSLFFTNNLLHVFADDFSTEKRVLATCPNFIKTESTHGKLDYIKSFKDYPAAFDKCFNDNFSFRNYIISLTNYAKIRLFGISPTGNIAIGKQGWFYYNDPKINSAFNGDAKYTQVQIDELNKLLNTRAEFLASKNIQYAMVVTPNKLTVYPEYLPDFYKRPNTQTVLEQFTDIVSSKPYIKFTNLKQAILKQKETKQVFFKTDSHWNNNSAILAYKELENFFKNDPKIKLIDSNTFLKKQEDYAGDLSLFTNTRHFIKDTAQDYYLVPSNKSKQVEKTLQYPLKTGEIVEHEKWVQQDKSLPKAVIIGDSYSDSMRTWLAENFSEMNYYKNTNGFVMAEIQKDNPDVVIQVFNESQLVDMPKQ